jgi:hypothetical protein
MPDRPPALGVLTLRRAVATLFDSRRLHRRVHSRHAALELTWPASEWDRHRADVDAGRITTGGRTASCVGPLRLVPDRLSRADILPERPGLPDGWHAAGIAG